MMDLKSPISVLKNITLCLLLGLAITVTVKAAEVTTVPTATPAQGLSISPDSLIIKETDIGKVNTIKLTNNTAQKLQLTGQEGIVSRNSDQKVVPVNQPVSTQYLEITPTEFSIDPGATFELNIRTKFTSTNISANFPAVIIKTKAGTTQDVGLNYEVYIPVLIQNLSGQYKLTTDLKLNIDRFTVDPQVTITGVINNDGGKFFNPSGTVVLFKGDTKLIEKEITTQVTGLEFPAESRSYTVNFVIPDTSFKGVGEYTVESHIGSDLSGSTTIARIKFIYIPKQLLYLSGGVLLGVIVISVLISLFRRPKKAI
jgi:hypothetical protein